jgi:hypothetical protein
MIKDQAFRWGFYRIYVTKSNSTSPKRSENFDVYICLIVVILSMLKVNQKQKINSGITFKVSKDSRDKYPGILI